MLFLTPLYLQSVRGEGALLTGIELLPLSVTYGFVSQLSGKIANKFGPRLPMTAGMAMMGTGLFMLALIPLNDSLFLIEAAMVVIGCGLGLNTAPVNAVAVANALPALKEQANHVTTGEHGAGIVELIESLIAGTLAEPA